MILMARLPIQRQTRLIAILTFIRASKKFVIVVTSCRKGRTQGLTKQGSVPGAVRVINSRGTFRSCIFVTFPR